MSELEWLKLRLWNLQRSISGMQFTATEIKKRIKRLEKSGQQPQ